VSFELVCEIEPPVRPNLMRVRHQIGVLSEVATAFLIPDSHLGRATLSSVAVAHEVQVMGGRTIACLNSRDRNALGFRRDLLTAAAYGVQEFLFVHGDKPSTGDRAGGLTVRAMIEQARALDQDRAFAGTTPFRVGAVTGLRPLPSWKREADFLFAQIGFSLESFLRWRDGYPVDLPVYAGVMVIASPSMAQRLAATLPDVELPGWLVDAIARDRSAGVHAACDLVLALRDSGAFAGVHLVPVSRYREVAARLEVDLAEAELP